MNVKLSWVGQLSLSLSTHTEVKCHFIYVNVRRFDQNQIKLHFELGLFFTTVYFSLFLFWIYSHTIPEKNPTNVCYCLWIWHSIKSKQCWLQLLKPEYCWLLLFCCLFHSMYKINSGFGSVIVAFRWLLITGSVRLVVLWRFGCDAATAKVSNACI